MLEKSTEHTAKNVIFLDPSLFIGQGKHQSCYRHPTVGNFCIKFIRSASQANVERELRYYRHLYRRGISWEMVSEYHGTVQTNLGSGHLFELITDFDGEISRPLHWYFEDTLRTSTHSNGIADALRDFSLYMLRHAIVAKNFDSKNLLYKRTNPESGLLVLVDDIGHRDLIPATTFIHSFARAKFRRRWRRYAHRLLHRNPANQALPAIINQMILSVPPHLE